jgi:glycosidase
MKKNNFIKPISLFVIIIFSLACNKTETFKSESKSLVTHPEWAKNATIYEVNVRQFSKEGSFDKVTEQIPRLKEMGIDILWLMPIHPIGELNRKGSLGSYYAVKDFKAVNPEFGTIEDFDKLVRTAHSHEMRVIIDWVANHTAWDNVWTNTNPEFFTLNKEGKFAPPVEDWADVIDLNYDNKELWNYMIDAMKYWVKNHDIDGFRCDVAAMVPLEFWKWARPQLDEIKPVFMLAEGHEPELHQAFDMTYNWQLKDLFVGFAKREKGVKDFYTFFENEKNIYSEDDYRMVFTTNHDENTWNGTDKERYGDAAEPFSVMIGVVPGMPLVYSGQESGLDKRLNFFEKDPIEWKKSEFENIFKELFNLKKNNMALWNGMSGGKMLKLESGNSAVFSFTRKKDDDQIIALFNLSSSIQKIQIKDENLRGTFNDLFGKKSVSLHSELIVQMNPWEYIIYHN